MNLPTMPALVRTLQRRRLSVTLAALAATGIALAGCSAGVQTTPSQASPSQSTSTPSTDAGSEAVAQELLAAHDLAGLDVREVIARLEATALVDRPDDLLASVQTDTLVLRDAGGREGRLPLPDDAVYVSIAPFPRSDPRVPLPQPHDVRGRARRHRGPSHRHDRRREPGRRRDQTNPGQRLRRRMGAPRPRDDADRREPGAERLRATVDDLSRRPHLHHGSPAAVSRSTTL